MQGFTTFWVFEFGKLEFSMVLEFHELKFYGKILKVLEFHELEFHQKNFCNFKGNFFKELELCDKLKFQKEVRSLHISKTVID